jgi:large subunit ribosomal protein L25
METVQIAAAKRHLAGKGVARQLRRAGQLPAVLYGNGETVAITIAGDDLERIRKSESGENTIVEFNVTGDTPETCHAILREIQIDPVSRASLHADFYRVEMNKPITVRVPLEFINEPHDRLRAADAILTVVMRELEVECLPRDIPEAIPVDLVALEVGDVLKVGDLILPPGVILVAEAEETVLTTTMPTVEEVAPEAGGEDIEAEEGATEAH